MIFAFLLTIFVGLCALAIIGLEDSHNKVTRLLEELDQPTPVDSKPTATPIMSARRNADALQELGFTRSLLALGKVGSPIPCDSPAPVPVESSSSESTHPDQSRNRVKAL